MLIQHLYIWKTVRPTTVTTLTHSSHLWFKLLKTCCKTLRNLLAYENTWMIRDCVRIPFSLSCGETSRQRVTLWRAIYNRCDYNRYSQGRCWWCTYWCNHHPAVFTDRGKEAGPEKQAHTHTHTHCINTDPETVEKIENGKWRKSRTKIGGCTSGGVYVPCINTHAR